MAMNRDEYPAKIGESLSDLQHLVRLFQDEVGRGKGGRETALVQTKLDEARMWLQEAVRALGAE
jgi:hypothetical protein